jgi:hypothetical protein
MQLNHATPQPVAAKPFPESANDALTPEAKRIAWREQMLEIHIAAALRLRILGGLR